MILPTVAGVDPRSFKQSATYSILTKQPKVISSNEFSENKMGEEGPEESL